MKRESTPFAILIVKNTPDDKVIWARFYWSLNSGIYGHQVITEFNDGSGFKTEKTGGCGYCKKSSALESFIKEVTGKYIGLGGDLDYYLGGSKYHHGGNYFEIDYADLLNIDKLNK